MSKLDDRIAKIREDAEKAIASERDKEARRELTRKRVREFNEQADELRAKLEDDHCLVGHSKADLLWTKAWEFGHDNGLAEVKYWYGELVELVR